MIFVIPSLARYASPGKIVISFSGKEAKTPEDSATHVGQKKSTRDVGTRISDVVYGEVSSQSAKVYNEEFFGEDVPLNPRVGNRRESGKRQILTSTAAGLAGILPFGLKMITRDYEMLGYKEELASWANSSDEKMRLDVYKHADPWSARQQATKLNDAMRQIADNPRIKDRQPFRFGFYSSRFPLTTCVYTVNSRRLIPDMLAIADRVNAKWQYSGENAALDVTG